MSTDGGSTYAVTKTTTFFRATHREDDSLAELGYRTGNDLAQSTSDQVLNDRLGNGNDESLSGCLHLFNPSSTTFVKHFLATINEYQDNDRSSESFIGGYGNTTSAVDAIKFQMSSGNIDSGQILLFLSLIHI